MKNLERFENAAELLSSFHLDWRDEFDEPEDAVAQFIQYADHQTRVNALRELGEIIAEFQGPDLNKTMLSMSCYYSPERYRGMPMGEWLEEVIAQLEQSLSD